MKNYTLTQRNTDFMKAVRRETILLNDSGFLPDVAAVIEKVLAGKAPQFYVDYETAYRYVSLARRGLLSSAIKGQRRQQWKDLAARVDDMMASHPEWTFARALVEAIDQGDAPSWYMSPDYARRLYFKLRREGYIARNTLLRNRDFTHS